MQCCFWHLQYVKGILWFTSSYSCTFPMKPRSKAFNYAHDDDVIEMKSTCLWSFSQGQVINQILQRLQQWFFGPEQQQLLSVLQVQRGTTVLVLWWWNKQILSTNWAQITFTRLHAEEQQWLPDLWVGWAWDSRSGPVTVYIEVSVFVHQ